MRILRLLVFCFLTITTACVTAKKYNGLESDYYGLKNQNDNLKVSLDEKTTDLNQMTAEKERLEKELEELKNENAELNKKQEEYLDLQKKVKNSSQKEIAELLSKIRKNEEELALRNKKLTELQTALNKNEESVNELRKKMSGALLGFEGKGLRVHQQNGKVYVSMDEKLLFQSGSYEIETPGKKALTEIAKVLEANPDINILIEGHTDNVRYVGSGTGGTLVDNWDLSVKRATTVLRALLKDGNIDPSRVTAAGRGEFAPLDTNDTKEGRQRNRRTEIILTPKLDELFKILQTN